MNTTQTRTAEPTPGTIVKTADCKHCGDQLVNYGRGWAHMTGEVGCS